MFPPSSLTHRWLSRDSADLIGHVRMHCYAASLSQRPQFVNSVLEDTRVRDGQFLIVEKDGRPVGTATSADLTMHLHDANGGFPCQGVAYVGTVRTERRKGAGRGGVATEVMNATLRRARDEGHALSALMPFRASYYEHFGFGLVERQNNWTIPLSLLPAADQEGRAGDWRPYSPADLPHLHALRNTLAAKGNCDMERPLGRWEAMIAAQESGFIFLTDDAWVLLKTEPEWTLRVTDWGAASPAALKRLLAFLGSLRDQYTRVHLTAPVDLPLNLLLKEPQLPHRPVAHTHATLHTITRMQLRVLDHLKVLNAIHWPKEATGSAVLSIQETEGHESRVKLDVHEGRSSAAPSSATPTFTTTDKTWASILSGELPAPTAACLGLASGDATPLTPLAHGPKPFTWEYF